MYYVGGIAKAKKYLLRAGFPWSTTKGRYYAFGPPQVTTPGVKVTRVGVSDTIALHIVEPMFSNTEAARERRELMRALALAVLRFEAHLPFNDAGFCDCRHTD